MNYLIRHTKYKRYVLDYDWVATTLTEWPHKAKKFNTLEEAYYLMAEIDDDELEAVGNINIEKIW